jgi:hypothetical protein
MKRKTTALITGGLAVVAFCAALAGVLGSTAPEAKAASCARGTKPAVIGGNFRCLRVGQQCSTRHQAAYRRYSFHCASGRLRRGTGLSAKPTPSPFSAKPTPSPFPTAPPPAPTPAAVDGHYKGHTSQLETFEFDITNGGRTFRGLKTGQINAGCTPQFNLYGGNFDWPNYTSPVSLSGDFTIDKDLTYVSDSYWSGGSGHLTIRGHIVGQSGSGSIEVNEALKSSEGISYTCGTGLQTWTVTRIG